MKKKRDLFTELIEGFDALKLHYSFGRIHQSREWSPRQRARQWATALSGPCGRFMSQANAIKPSISSVAAA